MILRHGSFFSGFGGFDLAAEWMGWENVFHCEINNFCNKILNYYWPNAHSFKDIKTTDFTFFRGKIDIVTGGFPCQPFSVAGKQKGTADERHLWPEMLRAIREIQPRWVLGENVFGLINWDGGVVFNQVQADLEASGYEVFPYVLPACGVDAPHRRYRVWFVAHRNASDTSVHGHERREFGESRSAPGQSEGKRLQRKRFRCNTDGISQPRPFTHTASKRGGQNNRKRTPGIINKNGKGSNWQHFPTQSPLFSRNDGLSARLDRITVSKWRNESIRGTGNAVVPQLVLQFYKTIEAYEQQLTAF
jgi:DNA (cytosine-5)-methyltransferase 1